MNECVINGNTASGQAAGGIWATNTPMKLHNCTFNANTVTGENGVGGALNIYGSLNYYSDSPYIFNCLFTKNTASNTGGAVSLSSYADPNIVNCTFADNQAAVKGGAIYSSGNSRAKIFNSIFANSLNYAIYKETGLGKVYVTYCYFWNLPAKVYGSGFYLYNVPFANWNNAQFDTFSQQFATGSLGNYYLTKPPPYICIDGGLGSAHLWGLDTRTSQPDNTLDSGVVNAGYHYSAAPIQYQLTVNVTGGVGTVDVSPATPNASGYYAGTMIAHRQTRRRLTH